MLNRKFITEVSSMDWNYLLVYQLDFYSMVHIQKQPCWFRFRWVLVRICSNCGQMYLAGSGTDDLLSILQANKRRTNYPHFYSNQRLYPHHDVFLYKVVPSPSIPDTARTERGLTKVSDRKNNPILGVQVLEGHREGNHFSLSPWQVRKRIQKFRPLNLSTENKLNSRAW